MTNDDSSMTRKQLRARKRRRGQGAVPVERMSELRRFLQGPRLWYVAIGGAVLIGSLSMLGYNILSTLAPGMMDPTNSRPVKRLAGERDRSTETADPEDPRQVELGSSIYANACALCHGKNLEGQPNWRTRLPTGEFPAPPHDQDGHTWHHPDQVLFRITKLGGQAEAPPGFKSNMPGFGNLFSDAEILAVLAYIKSRWPEPIRMRQAEINKRHQGR